MNLRKLLILLLLLPALVACGKKGPVRPLLQALPAAPGDFSVRQLGTRFLLAFELPTKNQDGSPLTDLQGFQVYKMKYDPVQDCPECRDTSVLLQSIDLDYLRGVTRSGNRLELWDGGLEPGFGYQYRVAAVTRKGAAGLPSVIRRSYFAPPAAPTGVQIAPHDQMVRLQWQPLTGFPKAGELAGYNVYRRLPGTPFPALPVNHAPVKTAFYEDYGVKNGQGYDYALRSVVTISGTVVEGPLSTIVSATPQAGR